MNEQKAIEYVKDLSHRGYSTHKEAKEIAIKALEEIQEYRKLGTVEELRALKEKNTPKKIKEERWIYTKCVCGRELSKHYGDGYYDIPYENKTNYCPDCGQRYDWGEEDEQEI